MFTSDDNRTELGSLTYIFYQHEMILMMVWHKKRKIIIKKKSNGITSNTNCTSLMFP